MQDVCVDVIDIAVIKRKREKKKHDEKNISIIERTDR